MPLQMLMIIVTTIFLLDTSTCVHVNIATNDTNITNHTSYEISAKETQIQRNKNCSLRPDNDEIVQTIKDFLEDGTKLIEYTLNINNPNRMFNDDVDSNMYRPFFWVRVTGRHGTSLLALRPEYDKLSLYSLAVGVEELNVTLVEEPTSCLSEMTYPEIETLIRELVMNDFQDPTGGSSNELADAEGVCNMHILDNKGVADFQYYCCKRNENGGLNCNYLDSDFWLNMLLGIVIAVKVLVVLYSPKLIPANLYNRQKAVKDYTYREETKLTAVKTNNPEKYRTKKIFRLSKFQHMNEFNKTLEEMTPDVPYSLQMNELNLQVKQERLVPSNKAPIGLFHSIYNAFFQCKISERASVNPCCKTDVFKMCKCCGIGQISWRTFLRRIMKILVLMIFATPWIIRIFIYYEVENTEMEIQKKTAEQKSLATYFPGNVTLYLTPVHIVFIVIYAMLTFETCIFKLIGKTAQNRFKLVLVRCLCDMRNTSQMDVISWLVRGAVAPCTAFGGLGIIVGLFAWVLALPFCIVIVAFYTFPTLNVSGRMLAHFFAYLLPDEVCSKFPVFAGCNNIINKIETTLHMEGMRKSDSLEKNAEIMKSPRMKLEQLVVIIMCLASFISVVFLLMEFTAFIVEILVYTFMGIIVNADSILTYISLLFLMGVYAQDCFGFVSTKFLNFNQTMNQVALSLGVNDVKKEIYLDEDQQSNMAFQINCEKAWSNELDKSAPVTLEANMDGFPRWSVSRVCLFLDKTDKPYIPRGYFFDACTKLNYHMAPGQLLISYLRAAAEFSVIVVFLLLVLVVVLAFGDTYELSAGNKMLATIAGGIVPFILRNVVFKSHDAPKITKDDTDTILFQAAFYTFLKGFKQTWPISDIKVKNLQSHGETKDIGTVEEQVNEVMNGSEMIPLVKTSNGTASNGHGHLTNDDIDFVIDCRGHNQTV